MLGVGYILGPRIAAVMVDKETKEAVIEKPSGISYAIPARLVRELLERATR